MEVLEEKQPETKPPETGPKPKIVRNRDVDKAAKELQDDYVLPLPPGKTLTWDAMQDWLRLLTPAMWSHVSCYLYRLKPKIRRQLRDKDAPSYIDCINEPFAMDYIVNRHGGGKYQMQVTDTDGKRENNANLLFKCHFDINDNQYPPILDYLELELDARENKSYIDWLRAKGVLGSDGRPVQPQAAPPSTSPAISAKDILDILGFAQKLTTDQQAQFRAQFAPSDPLGKSIGDILLEKMRQDDPGKDWDRMMAFMEKLHKPDNTMGPIVALLQAQIANGQEQRKTDLEYMRMVMEGQRREAAPRNQLAELRDMISIVKEIAGTGGGGKRSGWDTGLEIAREVALPAIQSIGGIISNIMALRGNPAAAAPGAAAARPPAPAAFDPYRNPGAARNYASTLPQQPPPAPAGPPPVAPQPPPQGPQEPTVEAQLLSLMQSYGGLIVNHMNSGTPGYDFADYVAGLLGVAVHANMCAPGEAALVAVMLKVPEIAVFGESRIRQFVNEFVHYQEYIEAAAGEEMPDEGEIVDAQPGPKIFRPPAKAATATRETGVPHA